MSIRPIIATAILVTFATGCAQRPTIIPNSDPALRKTSVEFSADAAKRTYPADATNAGTVIGRAQVGYTMNTLELVNLSDEDWINVEAWVNEEYVVHIPLVQHLQTGGSGRTKTLNFAMLYNRDGKSFPTDNRKVLVEKVEIVRDGKLYAVPLRLAD